MNDSNKHIDTFTDGEKALIEVAAVRAAKAAIAEFKREITDEGKRDIFTMSDNEMKEHRSDHEFVRPHRQSWNKSTGKIFTYGLLVIIVFGIIGIGATISAKLTAVLNAIGFQIGK